MDYRGVIGIDPGKHTGWAHFQDGLLVSAASITETEMLIAPPLTIIGPAIVIIEVPRVYPRGGKGDPNDLIDLAVLAGTIQGWYVSRAPGIATRLVAPRTWKGTVPKPIHNERVLAALTPAERALLPKRPRAKTFDHNMLDAVGLGLFQLKREYQR